jgi:hypothetical protein
MPSPNGLQLSDMADDPRLTEIRKITRQLADAAEEDRRRHERRRQLLAELYAEQGHTTAALAEAAGMSDRRLRQVLGGLVSPRVGGRPSKAKP